MPERRVLRYNQTGATVIGVLEILLGLACIAIHIPQYTEQVVTAFASTGIWAGVLYIIIGAVTLAAGRQGTRDLVKASLGLSVCGYFATFAAFAAALALAIVTGFASVSGYGREAEHQIRVSTDTDLGIMVMSVIVLILCIAASILGCLGLGCCSKQQKTYEATTTKDEYV